MRRLTPQKRMVPVKSIKRLAVALFALPLLGAGSCGVKQTERLPAQEVIPLQTATLEELVARLQQQADSVTSLNAETELRPSTGSAYSGVIEKYHDVKAFILAERRSTAADGAGRHIRLIGQAPIVRKNIFDMVADDERFRIYIPTKNKFIVGPTRLERRSDNPIENLRPQHLFSALFPQAPQPGAHTLREENEWGGQRYYGVTEILRTGDGELTFHRRWWFERTQLRLVRLQEYDAQGRLLADIHYSDWREVAGVPFPHQIELVRPHDDYRLKVIVKELALNEPLPPERFQLERPQGVELVELEEESEGDSQPQPQTRTSQKSPAETSR